MIDLATGESIPIPASSAAVVEQETEDWWAQILLEHPELADLEPVTEPREMHVNNNAVLERV